MKGDNLIVGDISSWDTSNVINMVGLFARKWIQSRFIFWDISNVTNMEALFFETTDFSSNISLWDVSNVTNMYGIFLIQLFFSDVSSWNVSSVTDMSYIYIKYRFHQIYLMGCIKCDQYGVNV